jgi:hypothetical protein
VLFFVLADIVERNGCFISLKEEDYSPLEDKRRKGEKEMDNIFGGGPGGSGGNNFMHTLSSKAKIFISLVQVVSTFQSVYSVPWPDVYLQFLASLDFFNLNLLSIPMITVDCVMKIDYYVTWKFYAITPVVLLTLLSLLFFIIYVVLVLRNAKTNQLEHFTDRAVQLLIWVVRVKSERMM